MQNFYEERPGYFVVRRTHPITGDVIAKKGRDKLALATWVELIESVRRKLAAGVISTAQALEQLSQGEGERMRVHEAWEEYFQGLKTPGTRRAFGASWEQHLREPLGALHLTELTETVIERWEIATRKKLNPQTGKPLANATVANAFNALKACLGKQLRLGRIARLPFGNYRIDVQKNAPLERETLADSHEMLCLIQAAAECDARERAHNRFADLAVRITIMLLCGLRQGELAALGWDDLQMRGLTPTLWVRHQVVRDWRTTPGWERPQTPPKHRRKAHVPLTADALHALQAQKQALRLMGPCLVCGAGKGIACEAGCKGVIRGWFRPNGPIFPGKGGAWRDNPTTIKPERIRELVRAALPDVDAERFVTHSLRHSFASAVHAALRGDTKRAMALTRHASPEVFGKYIHRVGRAEDVNPMPSLGVNVAPRPMLQAAPKAAEPYELQGIEEVDVEPLDVDEPPLVGGQFVADILRLAPETARAEEERRREERKVAQGQIRARYRARNATDFETAYRGWVAAGRPGIRPYQVTAAMEKVYDRERGRLKRQTKPVPWDVPAGVRTWEEVVRRVRGLGDKPAPKLDVGELRFINENRERPTPKGRCYIPVRWEGERRGRRARVRVLGAWMQFLKARDAAARSGSPPLHIGDEDLSEGEQTEGDRDEP